MNYTEQSFNYYVSIMNDRICHANCELVGTKPNNLRLEFDPNQFDGYPPVVRFNIELDSDGESDYIYFMPVISFPELNSSDLNYRDSAEYIIGLWKEAAEILTKAFIGSPYSVYNYTLEEDDDLY